LKTVRDFSKIPTDLKLVILDLPFKGKKIKNSTKNKVRSLENSKSEKV